MTFMRLVHAASVMGERANWGTQFLWPGTVVRVLPNKMSPITGERNEVFVEWPTAAFTQNGQVETGWLSSRAVLERVKTTKLYRDAVDKSVGVNPWDRLRWRIGMHGTTIKIPMVQHWLTKHAAQHRSELLDVIREFGGTAEKSDSTNTLAVSVVQLTTGREDITMSTDNAETTTTAATKFAKKSKKNGKQASSKKSTSRSVTKASTKSTKSTSKKGAAKKSVKRAAASENGNRPGRQSAYSGKVIVRLVKENPRREGTHGYNSWTLLRKGITYEQYIEAGGRRADLAWDLEKGNVKLSKAK